MIVQIAVTVLLCIISLLMFVSGMGRMIPAGFKLIPLIAAIALWGAVYLHSLTGRTSFIGVLLLIVFYLLLIISLPSGIFTAISMVFDSEKDIPAITVGPESAKKNIYIIYHPGGSSFTMNTLVNFAEILAKSGFKTTLYSANKKNNPDLRGAYIVGFTSPVYGGKIRPPVEDYIERSDLKGVRSFILLTAGGSDPKYCEQVAAELEKKGSKIVAEGVLGQYDTPESRRANFTRMAAELQQGQ